MLNKIIERLENSNVWGKCRNNPLLVKKVCIDIIRQAVQDFETEQSNRDGMCRYRCCRLCDSYKNGTRKT